MWKWIIRAALALSRNPKVRQWAKAQALKVAARIRGKAERKAANLLDAADL